MIAVLVLLSMVSAFQQGPEQPQMVAVPATNPIAIDGALDEGSWLEAEPVTAFLQYEPNEGSRAAQDSEVRVLYGSEALYVGAILFDDDPEAIERALGRRDEYNLADWFLVSIDSYFDRQTAYTFGVNAAGVQLDGIRSGGEGQGQGGPGGGGAGASGQQGFPGLDVSWDAVWTSHVRVGPRGWTVEMRIPYSMLRFSDAEEQLWGIHFTRRIPRLGEQSEWPLVPRTERSNLVALFGQLIGISGVDTRRNWQIRPYTVSRLISSEDPDSPGSGLRDGSFDLGADLKVSLGPNIILDATVNPDFGQVESDPAVLNLTAFETVYEERRPFFVEGITIYEFDVGPGQLLYTRRIGADEPIIGATKLSGRTAGGTSFGILGATTGDELEPTRHFGVARVKRQFGAYSTAGAIVTALNRPGPNDGARGNSLAGGVDWDLRFGNNRYGIEGFTAFTSRDSEFDGRSAETGFAGKVWLRRREGAWTGFLGADAFSDQFDPNDVGQLRQNNFFAFLLSIDHEVRGGGPIGPFLRASLESQAIQQLEFDSGLFTGQDISFDANLTTKNFQEIRIAINSEQLAGGYDPYETRGLDLWNKPATVELRTDFETDERRDWQLEPEAMIGGQDGGGRMYEIGLGGSWNVGTRLSLSGAFEVEWERDLLAWSSNESFIRDGDLWRIGSRSDSPDELLPTDYVAVEDGSNLTAILSERKPFDAGRYFAPIFGRRDTRAFDMVVRSNVTFTPTLSLQLFSQLFLARGRYEDFSILQDRDHLAAFDAFPKRDEFGLETLQSNLVLRWEYHPGSTVFLVWTHGRRAEDILNPLARIGRSPYDRSIGGQFSDTFDVYPENVFLVKLNYLFLN